MLVDWKLAWPFTIVDESAEEKKSREGREEAPMWPWCRLCRQRGTNPVQFVLNILQIDGVDGKNGVKYTPS